MDIERLENLSESIVACRRCEEAGIAVRHATRMNRGNGQRILIVGIEPGQTEIEKGEAFSGSAGKRLIEWLVLAGVGRSREEILTQVHMTSLCKCQVVLGNHLKQAVGNCFPFLEQQIAILNPRICITLGTVPFGILFGNNMDLEDAIGRTWVQSELGILLPILPQSCRIFALPHPSPRSTWLNSVAHMILLREALERLRSEL